MDLEDADEVGNGDEFQRRRSLATAMTSDGDKIEWR